MSSTLICPPPLCQNPALFSITENTCVFNHSRTCSKLTALLRYLTPWTRTLLRSWITNSLVTIVTLIFGGCLKIIVKQCISTVVIMRIILQGSYQGFFKVIKTGGKWEEKVLQFRRCTLLEVLIMWTSRTTEELSNSIIMLQPSSKTNDLGTTADGNAALKNRCWVW